jgi:hypothetical protein
VFETAGSGLRRRCLICASAARRAGARGKLRSPPPGVVKWRLHPTSQSIHMENNDQRYLVQQNKIADGDKKPPVFAKVMRSKEGKFEGVSFIKNKEKATVMTVAEAKEVTDWAASKKANAKEYVTKVICLGQ